MFISKKDNNIFDHYKIGKIIGTGGYGQVYRATHIVTGDIRAIKQVNKDKFEENKSRYRFEQEMTITRTMDHPHIIKLFEIYEDESKYQFVTEFCKGGELLDYIEKNEYLSEKTAIHFTKQILHALCYCHRRDVVHRDLKPENILLDTESDMANLKLIDFGLSDVIDDARHINQLYGTPFYTAPEIMKNRYSEKSDIWSCGCIIYVMLSGNLPFYDRESIKLQKQVVRGKFDMSEGRWQEISAVAKDLIKQMLTLNPKKRISAEDALKHPWITQERGQRYNSMDLPKIKVAIDSLADFHPNSKLQLAVLTFIASQVLSHDRTTDMIAAFREMDRNGDGQLTVSEIRSAYSQLYGEQNEGQAEDLMAKVDLDCSGGIDYSEFIVGTMNKQLLLQPENIKAAFDACDSDGNGCIEINEIRHFV